MAQWPPDLIGQSVKAGSGVFRVEPMSQDDLTEVSRVEKRCFSNPWPVSAYRRELRLPEQNFYAVLREVPGPMAPSPNNGHENGHQRPAAVTEAGRGLARFPRLAFGRRGESASARGNLVGFAGMWTMYDEAHVTTIGVDPDYRGRGFGEWLLLTLFEEAIRRGTAIVTLEVRVSNHTAQQLYRKYGFSIQGTRKRYYSDNDEDAYIMWSRSLHDRAYRAELAQLADALRRRLGDVAETMAPNGA